MGLPEIHHVPERVPERVQNEVGEFKTAGLSLAHLLSVQLMSLSSFIHSPSHENRTALENESPAEKTARNWRTSSDNPGLFG